MKPLLSEAPDNLSLQALGRASVQIVHDLKNQLNGLKLYATFLRKRLEKSDRAVDELETVNKLIAGLDRSAADLSLIVQYAQPVELHKQTGVDLEKVVRGVAASLDGSPRISGSLTGPVVVESGETSLMGEFDPLILTDALKSISLGAMRVLGTRNRDQSLRIGLRKDMNNGAPSGVVEWFGFKGVDHDPFRSFAGSDEIRMSVGARAVEAHGGSVEKVNDTLRVRLPLA